MESQNTNSGSYKFEKIVDTLIRLGGVVIDFDVVSRHLETLYPNPGLGNSHCCCHLPRSCFFFKNF